MEMNFICQKEKDEKKKDPFLLTSKKERNTKFQLKEWKESLDGRDSFFVSRGGETTTEGCSSS